MEHAADTKQSPLVFLDGRVKEAIEWLAPERKEEINKIRREAGFDVRIPDDQQWYEIHTAFGTTNFNRESMERIWAFCYGYMRFLHIKAKNKWAPGQEIDLTGVPELALARDLLHWATEDHHSFTDSARDTMPRDERRGWREDFPRPNQEAVDDDVKATNTLFVSVCAFILLHELGHNQGQHTRVSESTNDQHSLSPEEMEYAADDFAANFLLERRESDGRSDIFIHRTVAIAIALSLQASLEPYDKLGKRRDHPCTPDRLLHFWTKFIDTDEHRSLPKAPVIDCFHLVLGLHCLNAKDAKARALELPPQPGSLADALSSTYETMEAFLATMRPYFACPEYAGSG